MYKRSAYLEFGGWMLHHRCDEYSVHLSASELDPNALALRGLICPSRLWWSDHPPNSKSSS